MRYETWAPIDVIGSLAVPIGESENSDQPLNIGQNRWYGRVGAPIVWQIGSWAPERRTTLEFLPAVWIFGPNNDFVGKTMTTDALFQLEGHLTHNFAKGFWGSLDVAWYGREGDRSTMSPVEAEQRGSLLHGGLQTHPTPSSPWAMGRRSARRPERPPPGQFRVTLVDGWHSLVEGAKRLGGDQ